MSKCFLKDLCGKIKPNSLRIAIEDPVLAPFIEVNVKDSRGASIAQALSAIFLSILGVQRTFGVGNKSYPAVVKSMQVGLSNGAGCDIEIIDQEGGDFKNIFQKISRGGSATDYLIDVRWGWISRKCGDSSAPQVCGVGVGDPTQDPQPGMGSPKITFAIMSMSVHYNSAGTVKYVLHCIDMMQSMYDSKSAKVMGGGEVISLLDAVRELLKDERIVIEFKKFTDATTEGVFKFDARGMDMDPKEGPYGIWETRNLPVLAIIEEWFRSFLAKEEESKGIRILYDPSFNPPKLIFLAAIGPVCQYRFSGNFQVGTYAVNLGACSPVISFSPVIRYSGANAYAGGGSAGASHSGAVISKGPADCLANPTALPNIYNENPITLGFNLLVSPSRIEILGRMARALSESYNGSMMNALANNPMAPIQADLRIQGNPNLSRPLLLIGRFISLIVINPYQIQDGCVWSNSIYGNKCNEVLSKSNWQIEGVSHDIRDGSYTTTLRIRLAGPGQEMPLLGTLGGG